MAREQIEMDTHVLSIVHSTIDLRIRDRYESYERARKELSNPDLADFMEQDDDVRRLLEYARAEIECQLPGKFERIHTQNDPKYTTRR